MATSGAGRRRLLREAERGILVILKIPLIQAKGARGAGIVKIHRLFWVRHRKKPTLKFEWSTSSTNHELTLEANTPKEALDALIRELMGP